MNNPILDDLRDTIISEVAYLLFGEESDEVDNRLLEIWFDASGIPKAAETFVTNMTGADMDLYVTIINEVSDLIYGNDPSYAVSKLMHIWLDNSEIKTWYQKHTTPTQSS